jgi:nucleotide-binding universal stress UspA family protein
MAAHPEQAGPVLCAVDGSAGARAAAGVARSLAERLGVPLVLVSVVGRVTEPGVSAAPHGQERLAEEEQRTADELLRAVADEIGAADSERRIVFGSPADSILRVADEADASFVVLGTRSRGRMRAALLGSVSSDVAARSHRPVVLVPA